MADDLILEDNMAPAIILKSANLTLSFAILKERHFQIVLTQVCDFFQNGCERGKFKILCSQSLNLNWRFPPLSKMATYAVPLN